MLFSIILIKKSEAIFAMSATTANFTFNKDTKNTKETKETKETKSKKEVKPKKDEKDKKEMKPKKPVTTDTESENEPDVVLDTKPSNDGVDNKKVRKPRTERNNVFKPVGVKRPSLYTVFVKEYFASLHEGVDKSVSQAAKEYSKIKDDSKKMAKYREIYDALLQKYNNEYESQKQAAIDRGDFVEKKKRPMSAYMLFATSAEVRAHAKKHSLSVTDTARYSGAQWKAMSEVEKDKYNKLAMANKEAFDAESKPAAKPVAKPAANSSKNNKKPVATSAKSESDATTTDASSASESEATSASDSDSSSKKGKKKSGSSSKSGKKQTTIKEEDDDESDV
jgi:hypothetical protein